MKEKNFEKKLLLSLPKRHATAIKSQRPTAKLLNRKKKMYEKKCRKKKKFAAETKTPHHRHKIAAPQCEITKLMKKIEKLKKN